MPTLHDPGVLASLRSRVESLRPDVTPRWGRMSVDQMLWHVNQTMEQCVGRYSPPESKKPLPAPLLKFIVLNMPWPKNAPTNPGFVAQTRHDFAAERARCLTLIDEIAKRDLAAAWPVNRDFGRMSGKDWSRLQAKHLDHHLRQFGA